MSNQPIPINTTPSDIAIAAFVGCSLRYDPASSPTVSSHETLFEAAYNHRRALMIIHMPRPIWNDPVEEPATGTYNHLHWENHPDLAASIGIDIINLPVSKSVHVQTIPGQLISETPPTFRITHLPSATHLLIKNLWVYADYSPSLDDVDVEHLLSHHTKNAEAYAESIHRLHPNAHYWHAVNTTMPCGVDYWILPITSTP